jgi:hypothetical protein
MISVVGTGVGRSYAAQSTYTLQATITNSDEVKSGQSGDGKDGGIKLVSGKPVKNNSTAKNTTTDDPIKKYSNYIIVLAVIGIIAGLAIKVMARMQKHRRRYL